MLGVRSAYELFFIRLLSYRKGNPTKRVLVQLRPKAWRCQGLKKWELQYVLLKPNLPNGSAGFLWTTLLPFITLDMRGISLPLISFPFFLFCRVSALSSSPTGSSQSRSLTSVAISVLPLCAQNAEGVQVFPLFYLIAFFSPFLTWV